jgi:hypothetical protein
MRLPKAFLGSATDCPDPNAPMMVVLVHKARHQIIHVLLANDGFLFLSAVAVVALVVFALRVPETVKPDLSPHNGRCRQTTVSPERSALP